MLRVRTVFGALHSMYHPIWKLSERFVLCDGESHRQFVWTWGFVCKFWYLRPFTFLPQLHFYSATLLHLNIWMVLLPSLGVRDKSHVKLQTEDAKVQWWKRGFEGQLKLPSDLFALLSADFFTFMVNDSYPVLLHFASCLDFDSYSHGHPYCRFVG